MQPFIKQQSFKTHLRSRILYPWFVFYVQPMQCLKVLTMSGWNPPPGNRKMHGDLMYLYIVTVEDRHVSITASTRGFYLNQ